MANKRQRRQPPAQLPLYVQQAKLLDAPVRVTPTTQPQQTARAPLRQEQFDSYDAQHPEVYRAVRRHALAMLRRHQRIAVTAILSLVRAEVRGGISNSFAPYYARKLRAEDVRLAEVIICKPLQTSAPDTYVAQDGAA